MPQRIVQISDTHIFANLHGELLGVNTEASFQALLTLLKSDPMKPDSILLTGDLAQDGSDAAYARLADAMKPLHVPVYYLAGNHDDRAAMARVYPRDNLLADKHIVWGNWDFILLNSQKPGAVEGFLDATELAFLQDCLQRNPTHHAVVVFHHHPLPVGSTWLDRLGVINAAEFWDIIDAYPRVHTVLFGHVHQAFETKRKNVFCYAVPSTCIQFKSRSHDFALDEIPPAYRWIDLHPDGTLHTGIRHAPHYVGHFDPHAKGY